MVHEASLKVSDELKQKILRHIEATGPMSIAEYTHICMSDPKDGYYQQQHPIGRAGDFITAPEISQMFGELIAVWCIEAWRQMGEPGAFNLIELGPGRGVLMADLLRATQSVPKFVEAATITLVENSPKMRELQHEKLGEQCTWASDISKIPAGPSIFIANGFLDVLPFRQYVKHKSQWVERAIGANAEFSKLEFTISTGSIDSRALPEGSETEPDGAVFEIAPAREAIMQMVAEHVKEYSGTALLIDYGHAISGFGDTFQAVSKHEFTDPLATPGKADLTNHVDFFPLLKVAETAGCHPFPILTQGKFLLALGLLERAGTLGHGEDEATQARLKSEAERLALPGEMGDLFKCLAFASPKMPLPPFAIDD
ncbi:MAG: SAM-dependent methyltransferase [Rhizobiaceae bacterium]|nr:SAM-dependent methyltransferase [Rhizobiaceae bacterium]